MLLIIKRSEDVSHQHNSLQFCNLGISFQAYLSIGSNHSVKGVSDAKQDMEGSSLVEICENITSAFACLREEDK